MTAVFRHSGGQLDLFPEVAKKTLMPFASGPALPTKLSPLGWHGMTPASIEVDWQLAAELAPGGQAVKIMVEAGSPARKVGLRSGDYVVSVSPSPTDDMSLAECDARALPPGADVFIKFHRPVRGRTREIQVVVVRLRKRPSPAKAKPWQERPQVGHGPEVTPNERKRFLAEMASHPYMTSLGHRILVKLLLHYDGERGIYPSYRTIARDVNSKRKATASENIVRLGRLGVIEVLKGAGMKTQSGPTNRFIVHWPEGWGANVVKVNLQGKEGVRGSVPLRIST
jgi:hypothetical protein